MMNTVNELLDGRKTYIAGGVLIAYIVTQAINKQPLDEKIVWGLMGALGVFLRAGVAKG